LLFLAAALEIPLPAAPAVLLLPLLPLFAWSWALVLVAFWFHPTHGSIRLGGGLLRRLPTLAQHAVRWYFGLVLALFVAFPVIVIVVSMSHF
jgi:hypothetical protein